MKIINLQNTEIEADKVKEIKKHNSKDKYYILFTFKDSDWSRKFTFKSIVIRDITYQLLIYEINLMEK